MRTPAIQFLTVAILVCLTLSALGQGEVAGGPVHADADEPESRIPTGPGLPTPVYAPQVAPPATPRLIVAPHPMDQVQQNRILQRELAKLLEMQEQLKHKLAIAHEELGSQQPRNLPPLENGKLHAYRLQHIDPNLLAETLESFLGTSQLRLVPDVDNNILLTYSSEKVSKQISDLVKVLDAEKKSNALNISAFQTKEETQSLQIRIFWLADGMEESDSEQILPDAVIEAVGQLGLESPQLVAQSATSIAGNRGEPSHFQFRFPAKVGDQTLLFESEGELLLGPQPQLQLHVSVHSGYPIELAGKLSAPLGHYMVLGATNYAASGGGFGGGGGGLATVEDGSKRSTSRFAFVVQVVEAKSFAP